MLSRIYWYQGVHPRIVLQHTISYTLGIFLALIFGEKWYLIVPEKVQELHEPDLKRCWSSVCALEFIQMVWKEHFLVEQKAELTSSFWQVHTIIWVELSSQRILQKMLYANAMSYEVGSMPSGLVVPFNTHNDRSSSMLTNRGSFNFVLVFRFMFYIGKSLTKAVLYIWAIGPWPAL